jgi:hypothetical protein
MGYYKQGLTTGRQIADIAGGIQVESVAGASIAPFYIESGRSCLAPVKALDPHC